MGELKEQISSQDNVQKGIESNQPVEEGKDDKLLNHLLGQTKSYGPSGDNINTEEIIERNVQKVHNNTSKCEQIINMQMNRECDTPENNNLKTKETRPLIEEILSNADDSQTKLMEGIFNNKETKPEIKTNKIEEYFYLPVQQIEQQTCLKNSSNDLMKELTGDYEEANLISGVKSENKDNLQAEISTKKLVEEVFNEESCALSQNQDLCNEVEEIVDHTVVNNKTEEKFFSEVLLKSGQFGEENISTQCFNKRKTLEHGLFDNKPLKLKKVEAKEDISIKKYGNSCDLFGSYHDQSATNDLSIAVKDDLRHIGSILIPNSSVECEVAFENTTSIELKQTKKETLSSLSFKLLEEKGISSEKSVPLDEFKIKSSCVTLEDWQRLVDNNKVQFILNEEKTELSCNEKKDATDVGSDTSDSDSYSDTMKRGGLCANRCSEGMFKTNLINIDKVTEMFSSLPNIAAEITNCNSQENKITSCSLPNICQPLTLEDFPQIKKQQFTRNYSIFPELCGVKTKRAFEYKVVNNELKPEIDVSEVRDISSNIVQDIGLIKATTREIDNENSLSPEETDVNYDGLNPVNIENTDNNEIDTKQTIETNNGHGEELEDDHMSLAIKKSENEENNINPQVMRYINRSLELQIASSQSKTISNDEV